MDTTQNPNATVKQEEQGVTKKPENNSNTTEANERVSKQKKEQDEEAELRLARAHRQYRLQWAYSNSPQDRVAKKK